jgi:hypothetical protein
MTTAKTAGEALPFDKSEWEYPALPRELLPLIATGGEIGKAIQEYGWQCAETAWHEAQRTASAEPVAWFVDAASTSEHARPNWFEVHPGDPMWSDNWPRFGLYAAAPQPSAEPVALRSVELQRDVYGMCIVKINGREAIRDNGDIISHFATLDWFVQPSAEPVLSDEQIPPCPLGVAAGTSYDAWEQGWKAALAAIKALPNA